jgi:hypothetical protein
LAVSVCAVPIPSPSPHHTGQLAGHASVDVPLAEGGDLRLDESDLLGRPRGCLIGGPGLDPVAAQGRVLRRDPGMRVTVSSGVA